MRRARSRRRSVVATMLAVVTAALAGCSYETSSVAPVLPKPAETSRILAADGTLLTALEAEQNRDIVPLRDIPGTLIDAVVAIEDERFWLHNGVDVRGIIRAAKSNAEAGEITEGGSTITQQYVKNALLDPSQTVNRKLNEAVLALRLEESYSKEVILEQYLNIIYFGHGAYGAQSAAQTYFGKPVGALTLAESALLAGLIQAPSATDPFLAREAALERRNVVLDRMAELDMADQAAIDEAKLSPISLKEPDPDESYEAPHFVDAVIDWMLTNPEFGDTFEARRDLLFKGGLRITTTIDLDLQAQAERSVAAILDNPQVQPEAAVVAVEPQTGHVRAMVGGRDYFGSNDYAKVNLAMGAGRPAGSTFKPLVLAAGLEQGMSLSRRYPAPAKLTIPVAGQEPWEIFNYGESSGGTPNLTEATTWSYNTAYAQLMRDVGPDRAVDMASRLGITSPLLAVPALVLGTENVTVLEMASTYATFANRGTRVPPTLVTRITRADGTVLYERQGESYPAVSSDVADQVNYVLRRVVDRGTGAAAALDDRAVAGKTGTTENYGDAWFVGYTPQLATAVWVGYPQGQIAMVPGNPQASVPFRVAGGTWPSEIWHEFMAAAMEDQPVLEFTDPSDTALRSADRGQFTPAPTAAPAPTAPPPTTARPATSTTEKKDDKKDDDEDDEKPTTTSSPTTGAPSTTEAPTSTVGTIVTSTSAGASGGAGVTSGGSSG
jgi:penicillin-binding protein 1A